MGDADTADMNPYFWGPCLASKGSQQANKIYRLLADSEDLGGELGREGWESGLKFSFILGGARDQTQDLVHTTQVLCYWAIVPAPSLCFEIE